MSDSEEVISVPRSEEPVESSSSNEVLETLDMKNYQCKPTCMTGTTHPLLAGNKDIRRPEFTGSIRTRAVKDLYDDKKVEIAPHDERKWIGRTVTKVSDGERNIGEVVDYNDEIERFKIVYEDDKWEESYENELLKLAAPPKLVREYVDGIVHRNSEKKKRTASTSLKICLPIKSNQPKTREVKCKRTGKPAQNSATYVPLAIKEKKKDAYIWYH